MNSSGRVSSSRSNSKEDSFFVRCRICNEKSDGAHFGIDSCRACAAFFRRSMSLKKSYTCRRGGNNCDIRRKDIATCRKCRLRKCKEAGMAVENIQGQKGISSTPQTSSTEEAHVPPMEINDAPIEPQISQTSQTSIIPSYILQKSYDDDESKNFLLFMATQHRQLCIDRRAAEYSLGLNFSAEERKRALGDFLPGTNNKSSRIFRSHIPHVNTFIENCFPEIQHLDEHDRRVVINSFILNIYKMDCGYRTATKLPAYGNPKNTKYAISETTYIDHERIGDFFSESVDEKKRTTLADILQGYLKTTPMLLDAIKNLHLIEEEYMVLVGLCFWDPNYLISETGQRFSTICRRKLFHSFQYIHEKKGTENISVRLGDILIFYSLFLKTTAIMGELMELVNLFDGFGDDKTMYNMLIR